MSAARNIIEDLAEIGATIKPAGDRLILRAGPTEIPGALVNRVREAKAVLLATLATPADRADVTAPDTNEQLGNSRSQHAKYRTFASSVSRWLNEHPAPSPPGRCAWCGAPESSDATVVPFGVEPGTHTWLHPGCWPAWFEARKADAIEALRPTDTPVSFEGS